MKKFTGRYTTNTAKALKGSERILCQVSEDGTIYICNGFLLCTMNAPEYAATVQPLTCCEPGAWTFDKDGKHEDEAHKLDLVKLFADTAQRTADSGDQKGEVNMTTPNTGELLVQQAQEAERLRLLILADECKTIEEFREKLRERLNK